MLWHLQGADTRLHLGPNSPLVSLNITWVSLNSTQVGLNRAQVSRPTVQLSLMEMGKQYYFISLQLSYTSAKSPCITSCDRYRQRKNQWSSWNSNQPINRHRHEQTNTWYHVRNSKKVYIIEFKDLSNSPGLVYFAVGQWILSFACPTGSGSFLRKRFWENSNTVRGETIVF